MKTLLTMSEDEMLNTVKSIVKEAFAKNIKINALNCSADELNKCIEEKISKAKIFTAKHTAIEMLERILVSPSINLSYEKRKAIVYELTHGLARDCNYKELAMGLTMARFELNQKDYKAIYNYKQENR